MRVNTVAAVGVALAGWLAAGFAQSPSAQPPIVLNPPSPLTVPTIKASQDEVQRMTVPVLVDGHGPYPFVIDTGADRTVISRELAAALKLQPGVPVNLNSTGGVDLTQTAQIADLAVGPRRMQGLSAPTLSAANLGAMGLLGLDSLRDQRMVMDFRKSRMSVEASKPERFGTDVIVVRAHRRLGQLVLVDASIAGEPIFVILDSGAQTSIGNLALCKMVGCNGPGRDRSASEVISVSGRTTPARFAYLPLVKLGGVTVTNLPIAFADLHTFAEFDLNGMPAMLLGMDILRHFDRVTVDFGRKEVRFQMPL